ncbi:hypothetical protein C8J56DRAFT_1016670 [Mycena floridula]|nr:hypothetical protein C8J56DRAFT_1016670 [Mycena floridula]
MPPVTEPARSLVDRVEGWVSENKRAILLGTAAVAIAGGIAYYASTSTSQTSMSSKKEKEKKQRKKKTTKDADGPILEERKPRTEAIPEQPKYTAEQIAAMSAGERATLAAGLKAEGNAAYKKLAYSEAVDLYTRAIEVSPKAEPVFYSNRAACYMNLSPPNYELVVKDCDSALALDRNYVKALNRRGNALEALERYEESLNDFTAATFLQRFTDTAGAQAVERVLKKLATQEAGKIMATRELRLPSFTFISAYFAAFRPRPHPVLPVNPSTGDETLLLAFGALDAADYAHVVTLVNEALEQGISWDIGKAEALNLRATFKFLMGEIDSSKEDLLESIRLAPTFTQSLVKIASVHMEQSQPEEAFKCFELAISHNPNDPDIYYHRGQVLFIMGQFPEAAQNYTKSTELDDTFVFSHIQLAVAQYKSDNIANSMATFRRTLKAFPQRSEPPNYYGELLLDQQRYEDAVEKFERAIELEKASTKKSTPNVLPLVNKALAIWQWKQEFETAERICNEALALDPECDAAVASLAQFNLQQGKIEKALEYLQKQVDLARTEPELIHCLTYQYASKSQMVFMDNYPEMKSQLSAMAQAM